jgi:hypothetical protein
MKTIRRTGLRLACVLCGQNTFSAMALPKSTPPAASLVRAPEGLAYRCREHNGAAYLPSQILPCYFCGFHLAPTAPCYPVFICGLCSISNMQCVHFNS